jgi:hypothetical protein
MSKKVILKMSQKVSKIYLTRHQCSVQQSFLSHLMDSGFQNGAQTQVFASLPEMFHSSSTSAKIPSSSSQLTQYQLARRHERKRICLVGSVLK